MTVDGVTYVARDGRWFQKPVTGGAGGPSSAMRRSLVVDLGVTTRNGLSVHHLAPRPGTVIPLSAIGIADGSATGDVTFEFYTTETGMPVAMIVAASWSQTDGSVSQPVTMRRSSTTSITSVHPSRSRPCRRSGRRTPRSDTWLA
jgi:hypothetical protein